MIKPVAPRLDGTRVRVAETQPQYDPIDVVLTRDPNYPGPRGRETVPNTVIMAFELTGEERQRIINGEDIYIALLTYGEPQQPIMVSAGPEEFSERYSLRVQTSQELRGLEDSTGCCGGEGGTSCGCAPTHLGKDDGKPINDG